MIAISIDLNVSGEGEGSGGVDHIALSSTQLEPFGIRGHVIDETACRLINIPTG